jgi:flagellar biosynthesis anti-sigma factor FlgM
MVPVTTSHALLAVRCLHRAAADLVEEKRSMQIYGVSQLHGAQSLSGPHNSRVNPSQTVARSASAGDELQLSEAGQLASRLADIPEIRADRVQALREAIQSGTYETETKLSAALDRLLDEIG